LHGSSAPICGSASSARAANCGLQAPRMRRTLDTELLLERRLDVDLGEHAEAFLGERLGDGRDRLLEAHVHLLAECVLAHAFLSDLAIRA
jgi:hypothetical protein